MTLMNWDVAKVVKQPVTATLDILAIDVLPTHDVWTFLRRTNNQLIAPALTALLYCSTGRERISPLILILPSRSVSM